MNHIFEIKRVQLLFSRYFMENWRKDLTTGIVIFAVFALLPHIFSFPMVPMAAILYGIILFIGLIRVSARAFQDVHRTGSGMHYMMIPASRCEKYLVNWTLSLIAFPVACTILYVTGTLFGNLLEPILSHLINFKTIEASALFPSQFAWTKFLGYWLSLHACFFLGSLIFKKHPTTKTLMCLIAASIIISLLQVALLQSLWSGIELTQTNALKNLGTQMEHISYLSIVYQVFVIALILYFWLIAWFKLKETQV